MSYFPVSAITDRFNARNQSYVNDHALRQLEVVEQHERQILDIFADPALLQELRSRHSA